jgi:type IV secretory pathway VirB6-like protein
MFDIILAPFKAVGEFIIWGLIIYGVVQMVQLSTIIIRAYYTLKFMREAAKLVTALAHEVAELRRAINDPNIEKRGRAVLPPLHSGTHLQAGPPPLPPRLTRVE